MADQTFTSGQILTAAQMSTLQTDIGLAQITPSSVTNATLVGGVATVGTAVSPVTISGVFSSLFDNYRIVLSGIDASSANDGLNFILSGSGAGFYKYVSNFYLYTTGASASFNSSGANFFFTGLTGSNNDTQVVIDLFNPFKTERTGITAQSSGGAYMGSMGGQTTDSNSSTGFQFKGDGTTLTGGICVVYGYRKA
jgi:hypothetical protein